MMVFLLLNEELKMRIIKILVFFILLDTLTLIVIYLKWFVHHGHRNSTQTSESLLWAYQSTTKQRIHLVEGVKYLTEEEITSNKTHTTEFDKMTSASNSILYILGNQSSVHLGDEIRVRIDLFDGRGKRKHCGGDFIRVWMEDVENEASVSGDVIDHKNGSYTGLLRAVWVGKTHIHASIARKREEIALYYRIYREFRSIWIIIAKFKNGQFEESSKCSASPFSNNSVDWCNFTAWNWGFPWYCKRPTHPELKCSSWKETSSYIQLPIQLDETERRVLKWSLQTSPSLPPQKVHIDIVRRSDSSSATFSQDPTPCNKIHPNATWEQESPVGFYYKGVWRSRLCKEPLPQTRNAYRSCLQGRTLWIPGDSISNQFLRVLNFTMKLYFKAPINAHNPQNAFDKFSNISVMWHAHELPFYHGARQHIRSGNKAERIILELLPNTTRDIVVIYLYVHFTLVHPNVFRRHVQQHVQSAKKLLARAPNVTLAVRGPHAFSSSKRIGVISYWGLLYADILRKEFSSIKDRVVYLDYWDMTICKHLDIHPPYSTVKQMVHHLMSLLCFRT